MTSAATTTALHLYLVRHGETAWSVSGQHTGRSDIALTPHGEAEGRALQPWLAGRRFEHVFTSPRGRAQRTCALAGLGAGAAIEPDLAEWDYGAYEGLRSAEIAAARPGWSLFRDGCPEGESPQEVSARADRLLARLRALGGTIAVFSHGHFSVVLAARWVGLELGQAEHLLLDTGSVSVLSNHPRHVSRAVISLWNATPRGLGGEN